MDYLDFITLGDLPLKQKIKHLVYNYEVSTFDELDEDSKLELLYAAYKEEDNLKVLDFLECYGDREMFQKSFLAVLGGSENARITFKAVIMKAFKNYYRDYIDEIMEIVYEQYLIEKREEARDYQRENHQFQYQDDILKSFHLY